MRYILSLLLVLGSTTLASAQDLAGAKKFFDQSHLPTVSSTAPTNGQVLTWDSTLGKAKWAAVGGGGGSFDPAAATNITFASGQYRIRGSTSDGLTLEASVNGDDGMPVFLQGQNSDTGSSGATLRVNGGYGGAGADIIGYCSDAAAGSDGDGGKVVFHVGAKDGGGNAGYFSIQDVGGTSLFKVAYDGTVTGPADTTFNILAATPASSNGNNLTLRASAATSTNGDGGEVKLYSGNATGSSEFIGGGLIALYAGNGGATSVGGSITRQTGNGGSTSGASGSITDTIGSTTDGNVGSWAVVMPSATGTNRSGGVASIKLGAKTGSGTDGYFTIKNASDANLVKVGYDGTVTGPTGAAFNIIAATSQNLNLTAPNQILFNSAGDYMRMGNAFLNLSSAGGLAFCTESTATTIGSKLTYAKANYGGPDFHYLKFTSDLTGSEADEPTIFQLTSINNPGNLIHTLSMQMNNGDGTVLAYSSGGWSAPASLQLAAGGTSLTIYDSSNSFVLSHTRLDFGSGGPQIRSGSGSPESSVTAPVGSVYLRTGGGASTTFYVKESGTGNTGWVAK